MMGILRSSQKNCGWITSWIQASEKEWQKEDGGYGPEVGSMVMVELPVQVRRTILDAWGWCTGTTQRDGMGREEGGGFRMGNTCIPVADSF